LSFDDIEYAKVTQTIRSLPQEESDLVAAEVGSFVTGRPSLRDAGRWKQHTRGRIFCWRRVGLSVATASARVHTTQWGRDQSLGNAQPPSAIIDRDDTVDGRAAVVPSTGIHIEVRAGTRLFRARPVALRVTDAGVATVARLPRVTLLAQFGARDLSARPVALCVTDAGITAVARVPRVTLLAQLGARDLGTGPSMLVTYARVAAIGGRRRVTLYLTRVARVDPIDGVQVVPLLPDLLRRFVAEIFAFTVGAHDLSFEVMALRHVFGAQKPFHDEVARVHAVIRSVERDQLPLTAEVVVCVFITFTTRRHQKREGSQSHSPFHTFLSNCKAGASRRVFLRIPT
jgi:hypothetical protein